MTHEDAGHYAGKHPDTKIDANIARAIAEKENDGRITCAAAHAIAQQFGVTAQSVGINIDLLEKRIHHCQMGLFGHGRKRTKKIDPAPRVSQELEKAIAHAMQGDRITCEAAWRVAKQMGITRLELGAACEALQIKVKQCQLGAF
jgi:hypothetical protein